MNLRLLIGDPAFSGDYFGTLGLEGSYPNRVINVRYAKRFKLKPGESREEFYTRVATHYKKLHKRLKFDLIILEKNFDYDRIEPAFRKLPILYITTSGELTAQTRAKGYSIDKNFMIDWLKKQYIKHSIQLPTIHSGEIEELINQRNEISQINGSFKRMRGRHDDLFMCELIGCNTIRLWWNAQ